MTRAQVRRRSVKLRGIEIDVAEYGEGPDAVVLLSGGAVACEPCFPGLIDALAPESRVVVHDRIGSGASCASGAEVSVRAWADDTVQLLDTLGIERAVLIGHSLGGALAAHLSRAQPQRVAGALLLDPTPLNDASTCAMTSRAFTALGGIGRWPLVGAVLSNAIRRAGRPRDLSPAARAAFDATFVGEWLADTARAVASLRADAVAFAALPSKRPDGPVIVVSADRKPSHRFRRAHDELATMLGGRFEVWPGTQHSLHLQRPDVVVERARELLQAVPS